MNILIYYWFPKIPAKQHVVYFFDFLGILSLHFKIYHQILCPIEALLSFVNHLLHHPSLNMFNEKLPLPKRSETTRIFQMGNTWKHTPWTFHSKNPLNRKAFINSKKEARSSCQPIFRRKNKSLFVSGRPTKKTDPTPFPKIPTTKKRIQEVFTLPPTITIIEVEHGSLQD